VPNKIEEKQTVIISDPDSTVDLISDYAAKRADNTETALDRLMNNVQEDNAAATFDTPVEPAQKPVPSAIREAQDPEKPTRGVAKDIAVQTGGAVRDFVQNTAEGVATVLDWSLRHAPEGSPTLTGISPEQVEKGTLVDTPMDPNTLFQLPTVSEPQTVVGALTRGVGTFLLGFVPVAKALQITKGAATAKVGKTLLAGGIADFFVFDGQAERLSNLIQEVPILNNPVSQYLAATPGDTEVEGRLKNVLEGAGLEIGMVGAFIGALKGIRGLRKAKSATVEELTTAGVAAKAGDVAPAEDLLKTQKPLVQDVEFVEKIPKKVQPDNVIGNLPETGIVVANKTADGRIFVGEPGDLHFNISEKFGQQIRQEGKLKAGDPTFSEIGFINAEGKFLNREEALKEVRKIKPKFVSSIGDELDALDLREQTVATIKKQKISREIREAEKIFDTKGPIDLNVTVKEGDKALNINLANLNTTEDIDKVLLATADTFEESIKKATRGKIPEQTTEQLADDLGLTVAELLSRKTGEAFNAERAVAARKLLLSSAEKLQEMALKIRSVDATDKDFYIFRKAVIQHAAIQKQISGLTAEAGRLLQSFNIAAGSQKEQLVAIENILTSTGGRGSAKDLAQSILDAGSLGNVNKIINRAHSANTFDMAYEGWLNSILSGMRTHAVNILSTYTNTFLQIPDKVFASVYGKIFRTADGVRMSEAFHTAIGMVQGIGDGLKMAKASFDSEGLIDPLSKIELPNRQAITAQQVSQTFLGKTADKGLKSIGVRTLEEGGVAARFVDFFGTAVRFPGFRMLATEDAFFKGMNYRMTVHALSSRTALNEGLTGLELAARTRELIQKPSEAIRIEAMENAAVNTFTNRNKVASLFIKAKLNVPFLRYFIPFVNTPANIVKEVYQRTPFSILGGQMKADLLGRNGAVARDLAMGKVTTGSMLMAYAGKLAMDGKVTGSGPADRALQKIWLENNQPYSFKFELANGETRFVSYNRLEPVGMLMGFSADFSDIYHNLDDAELDEILAAATLSLSNNLTSKTWLRGITNAIDILEPDDIGSIERVFRDTAAGFVPNAFNQFNGAYIDPVLRDPRGFKQDANSQMLARLIDKAKQKSPGFSQDLPARRNLWGEVVEPRGTFGDGITESAINWLSPAYVKEVEGDALNELIIENQISIDLPKRKMRIPGFQKAVELTGEEYNRFVELAGKPAKEQLNRDITQDF